VPLALAADREAVWVTSAGDPAGLLLKLDARSGRLLASSRVGARPGGVAVAFGSVWVANGPTEVGNGGGAGRNTLWRIDRRSARTVAKIAVAQPHELAVAAGAVWVACDAPAVVRVDPRTNRVVATTRLRGGGPTNVAAAGGAVWALTRPAPCPGPCRSWSPTGIGCGWPAAG
jgi:DNA-binding beta-propeller fold protein YncE